MRKALYILGDLDDKDLIWLSERGEIRRAAEGATIIRAGDPVDDLFFVTEGALRVATPLGREVARLGVGDIIGEMSFVEKSPPSVTVTTTAPTRLLAVRREVFLQEFATNHAFAARFYRAMAVFLSDRLRSTTAAEEGLEDELDDGLLDQLNVAGDRMLRLIGLLEGRRP